MAGVWRKDRPRNQRGGQRNMQSSRGTRAEKTFMEAHAQFQENIKKHVVPDGDDSSEEEELEFGGILDSVLNSYSLSGGKREDLGRTGRFLEEVFSSGTAICLICIGTMKRIDAIWTCEECYCFFHLNCTIKWATDSIFNLKQSIEEYPQGSKVPLIQWSCPNCRHMYLESVIPKRYYCYCNKSEDPPFHPWLVPHSCGETCERPLQPACGHKCLLLCHPGPCPPCPKMVKTKCHCQKQSPQVHRCSNRFWSCGSVCGKLLKCGKHMCSEICHENECPPCLDESIQYCDCRSEKCLRPCSSTKWQCGKVCSKRYSCGFHVCEKICHSGKCGPCPLTQSRTCPCGKTSYELPCTTEVPLCGDTCGRLLECGIHSCSRPCHRDKCGSCLEVINKPCRCGMHVKEQPCRKEYVCDTKCKRIKNCRRHACNRKCCDGDCPPCEKICGRSLACGSHKCAAICHQGPCYPCVQTVKVNCYCKMTSVSVRCGIHKKTKPPKCSEPCKRPVDCHHKNMSVHPCHFGKCPPCREMCGLQHGTCGHTCEAKCHAIAPVLQVKRMIWETDVPSNNVPEKVPCPPCKVPVLIKCLGEHEEITMPCSSARQMSCGRKCGRTLTCGNHECEQPCHIVEGSETATSAGTNCDMCESSCTKARPDGCSHSCLKFCHPGKCPPCRQMIKVRCHCELNLMCINCFEWTGANAEKKASLQNCGNQCPKNYSCGHRCKSICHVGDCPDAALCRKKVKIHCKCHRMRVEFTCDLVRAGNAKVECDELCLKQKEEEEKARAIAKMQKEEEEARKNQEEMERFQKKLQGRKKQRQKFQEEKEAQRSIFAQYWIWFCSLAVVCFGVYIISLQF
ncbi:hypothetical protein R5R35_003052 [Gryllus longicercus]|uniref:NF-X1-type domain-containing protein n=1 Tax=Gryllus longicercus TaxID=2509291 RepID=A0AAN9ZAP7_9ORTH